MSDALAPLPAQPADVPWPTREWPRGEIPAQVDAMALAEHVSALTDLPAEDGSADAVLLVHRGRIVLEHYGPEADETSTLQSWSMAKSITHALVGLLVGDGRIDPGAALPVPEWRSPGDPRAAIRWLDALRMRDGLAFVEDYVDGGISDVIEMLWGRGKDDIAAYAADRDLAAAPGERFNYSSGTSNLVARALALVLEPDGDGAAREAAVRRLMREGLFGPLGMHSPIPKFDAAGTFKGSSFCFCTARDFARFGLLYLRGGRWEDRQLLPAAWVDDARRATHQLPEEAYGSHWWVDHRDPERFFASGYEGQRILIAPRQDLLVIRLGRSPNERVPALLEPMHAIPALFDAP